VQELTGQDTLTLIMTTIPTHPQYRNDRGPSECDILAWYPYFDECHKYFVDIAQHNDAIIALAAFLNIKLPFQKERPILHSVSPVLPHADLGKPHLRQPNVYSTQQNAMHAHAISVIPYIRRLVATGYDSSGILRGFFGDEWKRGVGALHEIERRNYLFAAKSTSWMDVKQSYDISMDESIPYLSPLKNATEMEIQQAENTWSEWLAMQDWMIGPRAPDALNNKRVKREPRE
jgi:hypothetical protein